MVLAKRVSFIVFLAVFMVSSIAFAALKMPEELNAEFAQYPDSKIESTHTTDDSVMAILEITGADIDEIFDFYKEIATGNDWEIVVESKTEEYQALQMTKGEKLGLIGIGSDGEIVTISLSING